MLLVDLLGWWYSRGWAWAASELFVKRTRSISAFFSIGDLLKTLFAPFRQDAMNVQGAPISVRLQVFGGNIISRFFGFIIRTMLIVVGLLLMVGNFIIASVAALVWPLVPATPIAVVVLFITGVGK